MRAFLSAYPWDLIDDDTDAVLDRLHGEVGVSGVSLWVASPPVTHLRVRDIHPRIFRTRGGLFFQPGEEHYVGTRCRPIASSWLKGRNPLARIADAGAERSMELRAIVSAAGTGRLAQRHPEMAAKNAFAVESHVSVCLANPDVQAYLCGLVADLSSNYRLSGLTITDFALGWFDALAPDLRVGAPLGETEAALLSVCFCESCHQKADAAGVDGSMALRSAQTVVQRSLDRGAASNQRLEAILADNKPLADYHHWGTEELSSLLRRLTEVCSCDLILDRRLGGAWHGQQEALGLSIPAAVITRIDRPEELSSALCPAARRSELRLPPIFAIGSHAPELVSTLSHAVERGFAGVEIDNYGLLPDAALTPIRQAIRFARRTTSE